MKVRVLLAAPALALALVGCSTLGEDELFTADPVPDAAAPADAEAPIDPTLDALYARVFEPLCSCHLQSTPAGGMNFRKEFIFTELVNRTATLPDAPDRVVPSDPDNSLLYLKLAAFTNGDPLDFGTPMPQSTTPLSAVQLAAVRQWIADGAANFENP